MLSSKFGTMFKIGLRTKGTIDFITFEAYQKEIKFIEGDKVWLLFDDEIVWAFEIKNKGVRKGKDIEGVLCETSIEISADHLIKLGSISVIKWKYHSTKTDQVYMNDIDVERQNNIKEMSIMMNLIKNVVVNGL